MTEEVQVKPSKNHWQALKNAPVKVALVLAVAIVMAGAGLLAWKLWSTDDSIDSLGSSEVIERNTSVSVDKTKEKKQDTKLVGRSRLLDLAVERGEQLERLPRVEGNSAQPGFNKLSLVSLQGPDNASFKELENSLKRDRQILLKQYGDAHPYTVENAVDLCLVSERLKQFNELQVLSASKQWSVMIAKLNSHARSKNKTKQSENNQPVNDWARLIDQVGTAKFCRWAQGSGEILVMILWGHQLNDEASKIVKEIVSVASIPEPDAQETYLSVQRLLNLARLCANQNQFGEAKEIIAVARQMAQKQTSAGLFNQKHAHAMCLLEESRLSLAQRDYSQAAELTRQAARLLEVSQDIDATQSSALRADVLEQLARSLSTMPGKMSEAIENQEACVRLRQRYFGKDGIYSSATALDLCRLLRQRLAAASGGKPADTKSADAEKEEKLLQQILAVCKRSASTGSNVLRAERNVNLLIPQTYFEMGLLAGTCGNFPRARECFQKACDLDMAFSEPSLIPNKVADLDALAGVDLRDGKLASARDLVLKASGYLNSYVADVLPQLSLAEQIAFTNNIESHMNCLLAVCKDDDSLPQIYVEVIRWKGFLIEQFRLRAALLKRKSDPEIASLLQEHQKITSKLLAISVSGEETDTSQSQRRKEEIERSINAFVRAKQHDSLALGGKALQNGLSSGEALIDLYEYAGAPWSFQGAQYAAIVTTKDRLCWVDLGASRVINEALSAWRSYGGVMSALPEIDAAKSQVKATDPWSKIRSLLHDPLASKLPASVSRLWISDESELSRLPWNVLFSKLGGPRGFEVCQVDSPRELIYLKRQENRVAAKRKNMLIVGGIDYSKHNPPAPPLEHAIAEVTQIRDEIQDRQVKCVVQSEFLNSPKPTRENIMNAMSDARLAHLVTHGYFNESDSEAAADTRSSRLRSLSGTRSSKTAGAFQMQTRNPLIESGLLISRSNGTGFLTAEELLDADLEGCRLVTLSACETARGREVSGQGVMGLRSALMGAGARSVLLSLWPVPDKPTSELMKVFYEKLLAGSTPVLALQDAQAAVRSHPQWRAPYYWGAWIIVGDGWKPVVGG